MNFPYDWLAPREFQSNPDGTWPPEVWEQICLLAQERKDAEVEPLFWIKK